MLVIMNRLLWYIKIHYGHNKSHLIIIKANSHKFANLTDGKLNIQEIKMISYLWHFQNIVDDFLDSLLT